MSYVEVDSKLVIEAAEERIQLIERLRDKEINRIVDKENSGLMGLFRKIIKKKCYYDEVFLSLEPTIIRKFWYFNRRIDEIKDLISMAKNNNKVFMTREEINDLSIILGAELVVCQSCKRTRAAWKMKETKTGWICFDNVDCEESGEECLTGVLCDEEPSKI